jgi:hypothetical protein
VRCSSFKADGPGARCRTRQTRIGASGQRQRPVAQAEVVRPEAESYVYSFRISSLIFINLRAAVLVPAEPTEPNAAPKLL